jgi:hypothetical protein
VKFDVTVWQVIMKWELISYNLRVLRRTNSYEDCATLSPEDNSVNTVCHEHLKTYEGELQELLNIFCIFGYGLYTGMHVIFTVMQRES